LPVALGVGHVDSGFLQAAQVLRSVPGINYVEGPVALLETLFDERKKHPVLLLFVMKEGTDMPGTVEDRTRQPDLLWRAHGTSPFCQRNAETGMRNSECGISVYAGLRILHSGFRTPHSALAYAALRQFYPKHDRKEAGRNDAAPSTTVANRMLIGKPKGQVVTPRLLLDWTKPYGLENGIASRKNPDPPGPSQIWRTCYSSMMTQP
jgi:hypothetical protein